MKSTVIKFDGKEYDFAKIIDTIERYLSFNKVEFEDWNTYFQVYQKAKISGFDKIYLTGLIQTLLGSTIMFKTRGQEELYNVYVQTLKEDLRKYSESEEHLNPTPISEEMDIPSKKK